MDKDYFDHLKEVNRTFYDQVRIADQKAAYIFTFMLALLVWSSEAREVFTIHTYAGASWAVVAVAIVAGGSLMLALVSAIAVVLPRRRTGGSSLFWGAWGDAGTRLMAAAEAKDPAYLVAEYRTNITHLAAICGVKYFWVGIAFRSVIVAVLAHLVLLAIR